MIKIWQFHGESNTEMGNEINCWLVADSRITPVAWLQSESVVNVGGEIEPYARVTISCVYERQQEKEK